MRTKSSEGINVVIRNTEKGARKIITANSLIVPISPKYKGSVRKNAEADISQLQMVLFGARVSDTRVMFVDSKRTPIPYRKHKARLSKKRTML